MTTPPPSLKPCPFCGGEAAFSGMDMQVQCKTSGCTGQSWMFETMQEAITAWNTRASAAPVEPEALASLVERLNSHMGKQDVPILLADCREAATPALALVAAALKARTAAKDR